MKFFCYNFMKARPVSQVIRDANRIIEGTKQYDREEDMMVFLFVPATALQAVLTSVDRRYVKIAAQNMCLQKHGQVTGEVTVPMLKELGADMVLAGAADRRFLCGETDEDAGEKLTDILENGFKSVLCVGEAEQAMPPQALRDMLVRQISLGCKKIPDNAFYRVGVVYQPLWSMGEHGSPVPAQRAEETCALIRDALAGTLPQAPEPVPVFYGGVMTEADAEQFLTSGLFDGIFIDDRHWDAGSFVRVVQNICGK